LRLDPHFPDKFGADPLEVIELVMAHEEAFDDTIPQKEMEQVKQFPSSQEVLDYLRNRKKGGRPN